MRGTAKRYTGKLQAIVLDWSGTTIDYGCIAPALVFVEIFKAAGVEVTLAEARKPMGMYKRDHIQAVLAMDSVRQRWQVAHGRLPNEDDLNQMYHEFIPRQMEVITQYADVIPQVLETLEQVRARGLKIGSCTGYTRAMMDALAPVAAQLGYIPDAIVVPDDVPMGRPSPYMLYANAMRLNVYPMSAVVKIGDTVVDVQEGLNAGAWTIALAKTGNEVGLSEAEFTALSAADAQARLATAYATLEQAGAHYVVDGLGDILPILDDIEARLAAGETP